MISIYKNPERNNTNSVFFRSAVEESFGCSFFLKKNQPIDKEGSTIANQRWSSVTVISCQYARVWSLAKEQDVDHKRGCNLGGVCSTAGNRLQSGCLPVYRYITWMLYMLLLWRRKRKGAKAPKSDYQRLIRELLNVTGVCE